MWKDNFIFFFYQILHKLIYYLLLRINFIFLQIRILARFRVISEKKNVAVNKP